MLSIILISLLNLMSPPQANKADAVLGKWLTEEGKSHILIYKCGNKYCGKIDWLRDPLKEDGSIKLDDNNPEASLRSKPLKGLDILKGFEYDADDEEWVDGTIYDPQNGKTYSCYMWMEGKQLKVKGYIGMSWIGRSTVWSRVN